MPRSQILRIESGGRSKRSDRVTEGGGGVNVDVSLLHGSSPTTEKKQLVADRLDRAAEDGETWRKRVTYLEEALDVNNDRLYDVLHSRARAQRFFPSFNFMKCCVSPKAGGGGVLLTPRTPPPPPGSAPACRCR